LDVGQRESGVGQHLQEVFERVGFQQPLGDVAAVVRVVGVVQT